MDRTLPTFLTSSTSGVFFRQRHRTIAQRSHAPHLYLLAHRERLQNHTFTTIPSCISPQPECKVADTVASRAASGRADGTTRGRGDWQCPQRFHSTSTVRQHE